MAKYHLNVLYVEDENETVEVMKPLLQEFFEGVYVAERVNDALAIARSKQFDVLLCDIKLPDGNGLDLIEKIKKLKEDIAVIILSAYDEKEYLFRAIKLSLCDYLLKPLRLEQFEKVVQKCVKQLCELRTRHLAYEDQLTKTYNRHKLHEVFGQLQEAKVPFGALLIDVDDFKPINDNYGHNTGDRVLQKLSKCIKENVRQNDIVGRWGGEEFLVLLPQIAKEDLQKKAYALCQKIADCELCKARAVTVSIGAGMYQEGEDFKEFVGRLDKALYKAKRYGKNRVELV